MGEISSTTAMRRRGVAISPQVIAAGSALCCPVSSVPAGPQAAVGPGIGLRRRQLIGNGAGLGGLGHPGQGRPRVLVGQPGRVGQGLWGGGALRLAEDARRGPVVGIAPTPDAGGYWLATANGRVYGFGDAKVYGSMATRHLAKPIAGITGAPGGRGYWLFGGDGGVFSFGDARYLGSAGASHLGSAVVAMAVAPNGHGYWLATSKGGVLRFGAVPVGPAKLASPLGSAVAAMAATPDAKGYWLVTTKGKVVAFGDAHDYGSMSGGRKAAIVGIAPTADGKGYWLAARDGAVFAFGDAHQAVAGHQAAPRPRPGQRHSPQLQRRQTQGQDGPRQPSHRTSGGPLHQPELFDQ